MAGLLLSMFMYEESLSPPKAEISLQINAISESVECVNVGAIIAMRL